MPEDFIDDKKTFFQEMPLFLFFFQFEDVCLDAALYLLDKGELHEGARANPRMVIRTISALVGHVDVIAKSRC